MSDLKALLNRYSESHAQMLTVIEEIRQFALDSLYADILHDIARLEKVHSVIIAGLQHRDERLVQEDGAPTLGVSVPVPDKFLQILADKEDDENG